MYKNRHIFHLNALNETVEACLLVNITLRQLNHPQLQLTLIIFPIQTAWLYTNVVKLSPFINFQGFSSIEVGYCDRIWYSQLYGLPLQCLHRFDRYFIIISWIWWNKPEQLENVMNGWLSIYSDIHDMDNNLKFLFRIECLQ